MSKQILLIITGGIAAYKALELIRLLRQSNVRVRCILTKSGEQFVTPLSVTALSGEGLYQDLWSLTDEHDMGHIRLARDNDLIVVAPATANFLAKCAYGLADDLASTCILANRGDVLTAPAMNVAMWENPATQTNIETLRLRGWHQIGPENGDMACGETGMGRMAQPQDIHDHILHILDQQDDKPLLGKKALVTSGPTIEPIDPVRVLANRSSGKQGHAIAQALQQAGAETTLITGPVSLPHPAGVRVVEVETADQMLKACQDALPADIAICAAAVADWKPDHQTDQKIKKTGSNTPIIHLSENPDILHTLAHLPDEQRPDQVIGFCAETSNLIEFAQAKLKRKGCDAILANQVGGESCPFAKDHSHIHWMDKNGGQEDWSPLLKSEIAARLITKLTKGI